MHVPCGTVLLIVAVWAREWVLCGTASRLHGDLCVGGRALPRLAREVTVSVCRVPAGDDLAMTDGLTL